MVTRSQIDRLAERVEALAKTASPADAPPEWWIVKGDRAWPHRGSEKDAISYAEMREHLAARPTAFGHIVMRTVHADNGRPAACCLPGGACHLIHGD